VEYWTLALIVWVGVGFQSKRRLLERFSVSRVMSVTLKRVRPGLSMVSGLPAALVTAEKVV